MNGYYDIEKIKSYKQNYHVTRSKRKVRLSQVEIYGEIDEETRKKLIKEIYKGEKQDV